MSCGRRRALLEDRARELDLEVARRVDGERVRLEEALRRGFAEQQDLKLKEKDKLIDDLRRSLDEAKRKSEQGSQQRQGEVLERIDVEAFAALQTGLNASARRAWPALATALREQLIEVAFAHAAADGKHEKMEFLYRYLSGDQFRRRIEATVEAFAALQTGLNRERAAMERIWKEREKQIERVLANTAGMYGEVRGIVGSSVPRVPALELDAVAGRLQDETADMTA